MADKNEMLQIVLSNLKRTFLNIKLNPLKYFSNLGGIIVLAVIAGFVFRFLVWMPYTVLDESMNPLLLPGDKVLTNRLINTFTFGSWEPEKNDLVISVHPLHTNQKTLKRVAAKSGDRLEIKNQFLFVNGKRQSLVTLTQKSGIPQTPFYDPRNTFTPLNIPKIGDTLIFDKMKLREFDFGTNLLKQIYPDKEVTVSCDLMIDNKIAKPDEFQSMLHLTLDKNKDMDLSSMAWYNLQNLQNQLEKRFPEKRIKFLRSLHIDGRKVSHHVIQDPCFFIIGDNPGNSYDSRFWGYITKKSLISKPFIICWSKEPGSVFKIKFSRLLKFIK